MRRLSSVLLLICLAANLSVCAASAVTSMSPTQIPATPTPLPPTPIPPTPSPLPEFSQDLTISFDAAADWLTDLPAEDRDDQIRDWAVLGLAALLNLDVETLRNAFYDQTPLRDPLLNDFTRAKTGPGRGLLDGANRLHVLVPVKDPYTARTIGLVLDDYRKDAGEDPAQVIIYRYQVDPNARRLTLKPEPALPAKAVRDQYGYREMRVDTLADLQRFLTQTQHLSRLELRDGQLWAGGWNWPGIPGGQVTAADLTVIQRGYENAAAGKSSETGFSLDPGAPMTVTDLIALLDPVKYAQLKTLAPKVAAFVTSYVTASTSQERQALVDNLDEAVYRLLRNDEKLFSLLLDTAEGRSPYQAARYDGGLQGTEAGMTYFYTDLVAKAWPMEIGSGNPTGRVPGFISDLKAKTPLGHCTTGDEEGRLWFGLRDEAIAPSDRRIDLGSITTRVFTLIHDPAGGSQEIEPSYSFGRIIWWWDRYYQAMADYEPQYHRLDQLMRWSTAIAWLMTQDTVRLPVTPPAEIKTDWQFGDWLKKHPELKWRFDIPFVNPPGQTTETLLRLYSDTYSDCGSDSRYWSGGISNPGIGQVLGVYQAQPTLDPSLARGALDKMGTTFSPFTGGGIIADLAGTKHALSPVVGSRTKVDVEANGRKVWSLGQVKAWVSETAPRKLSMDLESRPGAINERLSVQGIPMGDLSVTATSTTASIQFAQGPLAAARRVIAVLQSKLEKGTLSETFKSVEGASMSHFDPSGKLYLRLDGTDGSRWVMIEKGASVPAEEMAFRLGVPGPAEAEIAWYNARFTKAPDLSALWIRIQEGKGDVAGVVQPANAPTQKATQLTAGYVHSPRQGSLYQENGQFLTRVDDPVFGLEGTGDGRLLGKREIYDRVKALRQSAQATGDGYMRVLQLPNRSIVLVGAQDPVRIVPPNDPWHVRLQAALNNAPDKNKVLEQTQGDLALLVTKSEAKLAGRPEGTFDLADVLKVNGILPGTTFARGAPMYFAQGLVSRLPRGIMEEGRLPAGGIGSGLRVRIVQIQEPAVGLAGVGRTDLVAWDGTEWVVPGGGYLQSEQTASPAMPHFQIPAPALGGTPGPKAPPGASPSLITLIYLADDCDRDPTLARCQSLR